MKYKIKIDLLDESGKKLASTTMTEEHARAIKLVHGVDVLLDTIDIMKNAIGPTETMEVDRSAE